MVPSPAAEDIVAGAADERIVCLGAVTPGDQIMVIPTVDQIMTVVAEELVIAILAEDLIRATFGAVAAVAEDGVVADSTM